MGHRLQLLTAPRQSYKLTPSQRPPLAVGSLTSCDIIFGHSVDFKKRSYCEEHPSEKSIQIGDSKQQDEEVAAEPGFCIEICGSTRDVESPCSFKLLFAFVEHSDSRKPRPKACGLPLALQRKLMG